MALTREELQRYAALQATRQGLEPGLVFAVAQQESGWNPEARGKSGEIGIMQLMPGTASDLGVNPHSATENIRGGVTYLKQQLTRFGGDTRQALAAYNTGPGTVQHVGVTPAGSAYASAVQGRTLATPVARDEGPTARITALRAELARRQQAPEPAASTRPEIVIEKTTAPETPTRPPAMSRSLADDIEAFPPSAAPTMTVPPEGTPYTSGATYTPLKTAGGYLKDVGATAIDIGAQAGGAALGGIAGPVGAVGGAMAGSVGAEYVNDLLTLRESSPLGYGMAVVSPLVPYIPRAAKGVARVATGARQAEKAIAKAGEETAEQLATATTRHADEMATFTAAGERRAAVQAERQTVRTAAHTEREAERLTAHTAAVTKAEAEAAEATAAAQRAYAEKGKAAYDTASAKAKELQATYRAEREAYDTAVAAQTKAVTQARAVPGKYAPAIPARTLYKQLDDVAGDALVDLAETKGRFAALKAELEPLTALQPEANKLKAVFSTADALGDTATVKDINKFLRELTPLTQSRNGTVRYQALQAFDEMSEAVVRTGKELPETAAASELMTQARAAWRQERAVETLADKLATGGPVISKDVAGREVLDLKAALNIMDKTINRDRFFAGSFTKEQLAAMRKDFDALIGTPSIPRQRPTAPGPVRYAEGTPTAPVTPRAVPAFEPRRLRDLGRTAQEIAPTPPPTFTAPEPVAPVLEKRSLRTYLGEAGVGGLAVGSTLGVPAGIALGVGLAVGDAVRHRVAQHLITPEGRALLLKMASQTGTVPLKAFAEAAAGTSVAQGELQRRDKAALEAQRKARGAGPGGTLRQLGTR